MYSVLEHLCPAHFSTWTFSVERAHMRVRVPQDRAARRTSALLLRQAARGGT
jgi:hypothetical protein|eukprot:COSAG01_NODE_2657_length_7304_cov_5.064122_6_plen_52_part_00